MITGEKDVTFLSGKIRLNKSIDVFAREKHVWGGRVRTDVLSDSNVRRTTVNE